MGYTRAATARNVILSDDKRLVHLAFRDVTEDAWWMRGKIVVFCQASRGFVPAKKQRHCRYATYTRRSVTCVFCLVR